MELRYPDSWVQICHEHIVSFSLELQKEGKHGSTISLFVMVVAMIAEILEPLLSCLLMIDGAAECFPLFTVLFLLHSWVCKRTCFIWKSKKYGQLFDLFPYTVTILMSQLSSQWIVRASVVDWFICRWSNTHGFSGTCAGTKRSREVNPPQFLLFFFVPYTSCQNQIRYIVTCCNETNCR